MKVLGIVCCTDLLTVEGLNDSLSALAMDKSQFSHDGVGGQQSAGVHFAAHVQHDSLDIGGGGARGEVLGEHNQRLALSGAAHAEARGRRLAGGCAAIALSFDGVVAVGLRVGGACVVFAVVVVGAGLAWCRAVRARLGGCGAGCTGCGRRAVAARRFGSLEGMSQDSIRFDSIVYSG